MACGKYFRVYAVGAFSAIGGFLFGYHTGVISGVLIVNDFQNMTHNYHDNSSANRTTDYTDLKNSGIVGILLVGCFLGSLIGGQTSDRFSRKYSISIFSFIFTISAAIQTGSYYLAMILTGRFFAGISIGALSMIIPIYHSEIAETKVRGRVITLQQWAITIGIAISFWINVLAQDFPDKHGATWRFPLGVQLVPSLVLAIGILFCPFSPRWLISQDREDEARDVLLKIRSASHDEIEEEMDRIKKEVAYLRENEIEHYYQLFRPPLLRPFILGVGIQILQQMTGINATLYYAPIIFKKLPYGKQRIGPLLATGIQGTVNVIATIPTIVFVDKVGRRVLLMTGAIIMTISMAIVAVLTSLKTDEECASDNKECSAIFKANLIFIYTFIGGFAFSWGPIPWIYCTEIFPVTMRAKATSLTTAANWATNCATSFIALNLIRHSGLFTTFAILCGTMIGIVYFFYPETKRIHLERNDAGESGRVFVPQWLEEKRKNYNTFGQKTIANQAQIPVASERNSLSQSNQINSSDLAIERDDDLRENNSDGNVVFS